MCKTRSTGAGGSHLGHLGGRGTVGVERGRFFMSDVKVSHKSMA